jgi:hypothetical protein
LSDYVLTVLAIQGRTRKEIWCHIAYHIPSFVLSHGDKPDTPQENTTTKKPGRKNILFGWSCISSIAGASPLLPLFEKKKKSP